MGQSTFGGELRRLREQRGLSLKKFAQLVHYDSGYLSKIENGLKPLTATLATACDEVLDTDGLFGKLVTDHSAQTRRRLDSGNLSDPRALVLWEPDGVVGEALELTGFYLALGRREALTDGAALIGAVLIGPLRGWLLPLRDVAEQARGLSADEVAAIESGVRFIRRWAKHGDRETVRRAVLTQLSDVSSRLESVRPGVLRDRAFMAGAQLSRLAASLAWDMDATIDAQRYYVLAAKMAHVASDAGYAALTLADLARQSLDLGRPEDALELVQLAQYGSRNSKEIKLRAFLCTREDWAFAHLNRPRDFQRAGSQAEELFFEVDASDCPTWLTNFNEAELFGVLGARHRDMALVSAETSHIHLAERYINHALSLRAADQIRNQTFDLIGLARTYLIMSEVEQACSVARQAVEISQGVMNGRPRRKLHDFCRELIPYQNTATGREFTEYIHDLRK